MYNVVNMPAALHLPPKPPNRHPLTLLESAFEHPIRIRALSEQSESKDLSQSLTPLECAFTCCDELTPLESAFTHNPGGGSPLHPNRGKNMNNQTDNSNAVNIPVLLEQPPEARCHHHTRKGRCTMPLADPASVFCPDHARLRKKRPYLSDLSDSADLSAELTAGLADFKSAAPINDFLSRLLVLQAQGRIAARRAAVMIFNCNQILHSLTAMARENQADKPAPMTVIWDIPGVSPLKDERG